MIRRIWIWLIVIISILLLLGLGIFLLYYFLEMKNWPLAINLEAIGKDTQVSVYMNSTEAYKNVKLIKNQLKSFKLGKNIINNMTNRPFTKHQVNRIIVYLSENSEVKFNPEKMPKSLQIELANDLPGFSQIEANTSNLLNGNWNKKGYYIITWK
jgi:hypothetical protein